MTSEISNKDETQLKDELRKRLMEHKYLIVLDDVWTTKAWDAIKVCIPDKDDGSKVMITTRIYEVARFVSERPHNMKSQTPYKSLELFSRKVFREGCLCTPELLELGGSLYKFQLLKLQNLQTLIVCSWIEEYPLQLQSDILYLPQLRHLHLQNRCSQYLPSKERENLQTLYWLKVTSADRNPNFKMVPNLKELGIYVEGELLSGCLESLVQLHLLEKLKFRIGRVDRFCLPTSFPSKLKKLTLCSTYLLWEKMGVIGNLSNLEVLKLKDFAFCGPKWEPRVGEFKRLKVLLIARSDLEQWETDLHHFPILERLILSCTSSLVGSTKKWLEGMTNCPLRFRQVGIKVELPDNESFEEVTLESSEEESVESSKEESVKSSKKESLKSSKEESLKSSKEESVKSSKEESGGSTKELSVGSTEELSFGSSDQERLKPRRSVRKYVKKKVSKLLNALK
nr:putative late blight resistance protein homolog R1B-17 [Ipomoea batatas]